MARLCHTARRWCSCFWAAVILGLAANPRQCLALHWRQDQRCGAWHPQFWHTIAYCSIWVQFYSYLWRKKGCWWAMGCYCKTGHIWTLGKCLKLHSRPRRWPLRSSREAKKHGWQRWRRSAVCHKSTATLGVASMAPVPSLSGWVRHRSGDASLLQQLWLLQGRSFVHRWNWSSSPVQSPGTRCSCGTGDALDPQRLCGLQCQDGDLQVWEHNETAQKSAV